MTLGNDRWEKKELFGIDHRPLPGGAVSAERVVRKEEDFEPVTYWPRSRMFYKELLNYDIKRVVDCTPLVPALGVECAVQ